ncbi:phosphodiesterase [Denitrobaculum tricleocarpae]|uniref:Phosphodiesterase n=1 Tax=Denitrobaculum tricleocarpae TaxID=2591009 RepID=A0A545TQ54_9PROT|nr:phosphodiesterase [Denitrobaculum tricleocarpae]TQV79363.1 phosphodiesterase [Denitrobaculum tricleocarpae]
MKLIHLTDTHFVPRGETLYGGDPRIVLEAAVADINKHHRDADLVCITGDLTHWGEPEAFESLAEVLSPLKPPLQLLLGNHDDRAVFSEHFPDQARDENGFVQSVRKTAQGHLIFLDTNLEGTHAGWYCDTRRAWLKAQLATAEEQDAPVLLFMHHPPFPIGLAPLDRISLQEPEAFAATVEPYAGRIRHLFFGHIHRPLSGNWKGMSVSSLRAMNHQCWFDLEAESAIAGSFEPPAYAVVLIGDDSVVIHTHDFLDKSRKFSLRESPVEDWAVRYAHP